MLTPYEYEQFEHWTAYVRRQTRREMHQLRALRAREAQGIVTEAPFARVQRWWRSIQHVVQGGIPALERAVVQFVAPNARPERLLPDAPAHR